MDSSKPTSPLTMVTHVELASRADDLQAGLIDTFLNLERIDSNLYLARHLLKGRKSYDAVYGGQVVGQALAAAASTVKEEFIPHSLHSYFIKTGSVNKPILYMIDPVRDGKSFCTRIVKAVQDGEALFTCQISFHKNERDAISHQLIMPEVPDPETLKEARMLATEFLEKGIGTDRMKAVLRNQLRETSSAFDRVFDVRPAFPDNYVMEEETDGRSMIWIKTRQPVGDDQRLHDCVAAYLTDLSMVQTAIRPHLRTGFIPSMAFSLDHCVWLHDSSFRVDEWMLYETVSTKARGSRAFIEGRLWTKDGKLVVSTAQEALIRSRPNRAKQQSKL